MFWCNNIFIVIRIAYLYNIYWHFNSTFHIVEEAEELTCSLLLYPQVEVQSMRRSIQMLPCYTHSGSSPIILRSIPSSLLYNILLHSPCFVNHGKMLTSQTDTVPTSHTVLYCHTYYSIQIIYFYLHSGVYLIICPSLSNTKSPYKDTCSVS